MNTDNDSFDPAPGGYGAYDFLRTRAPDLRRKAGQSPFYAPNGVAERATMVLMIGTGERGTVTLTLNLDIMDPGTKASGEGRFSLGLHTSLDKPTFAAGTLKTIADGACERAVTIVELTGWINPHEMPDNWVNLRATIKLYSHRPELSIATLSYIAQDGSAPIVLRNLPVSMSEMAML